MGIALSTCFDRTLSENQKEKRLFNRYEYLKCTFDHYLLSTSKNIVKLSHSHAGSYDYDGIKMLCKSGRKFKTIADLITLLSYVPKNCVGVNFRPLFQDYVIQFKRGMMKVQHARKVRCKNKYSTNYMLLWNDYYWQNHFFYSLDEENLIAIPFMTTCSILEIMNLEYNLFVDEDWQSQDFQSFLKDCESINIPIALLNKLLTWTIIHQDNILIRLRNHSEKLRKHETIDLSLEEQYKKQLEFVMCLKQLFVVDLEVN